MQDFRPMMANVMQTLRVARVTKSPGDDVLLGGMDPETVDAGARRWPVRREAPRSGARILTITPNKVWSGAAAGAEPSPVTLAAKRAVDLTIATGLLILFLPLLVGIAVRVRATSRGPALFRQVRYGRGNAKFVILKFRTMYVDAQDESGRLQTVAGDRRVTPLGAFLRRTSLDELPQLLNVIMGDMSLVGPRPHVPGMLAGGMLYEDLVACYFERHRVRPGVTGLAQASGLRGPTTDPAHARRRIELDNEYIERLSLFLDLKILWRTFVQEFIKGSGC